MGSEMAIDLEALKEGLEQTMMASLEGFAAPDTPPDETEKDLVTFCNTAHTLSNIAPDRVATIPENLMNDIDEVAGVSAVEVMTPKQKEACVRVATELGIQLSAADEERTPQALLNYVTAQKGQG